MPAVRRGNVHFTTFDVHDNQTSHNTVQIQIQPSKTNEERKKKKKTVKKNRQKFLLFQPEETLVIFDPLSRWMPVFHRWHSVPRSLKP
jgi:hypothetical protein